jgi:hypothetical protein
MICILLASKIWGEEKDYEVYAKDENIVQVDPSKGIIIGRAAGKETSVSQLQYIQNVHTTRHLTARHLTTRHFSTRHPDNSLP